MLLCFVVFRSSGGVKVTLLRWCGDISFSFIRIPRSDDVSYCMIIYYLYPWKGTDMSRHRNVRSMNYSDEYDGYDDVYGHSVEEEYCISPSAAQFMYDRNRGPNAMSSFIDQHTNIQEEDEDFIDTPHERISRRDSEDFRSLNLSEFDETRLMSCLEELRNVLGDTMPENMLVNTALSTSFDVTKSLDILLNSTQKPNTPKGIQEDTKQINHRNDKKTPQTLLIDPSVRIVAPTAELKVVKGFKIESSSNSATPRSQSPNSGRATPCKSPEPSSETYEIKNTNRVRENRMDPSAHYQFERGSQKEHLHIIVIGHVDAGKSTLMGRLLCDLGEVNQRTLHKYEQESKKLGKQSFMYAWVLDETGEERLRGITMDVGRAQFSTKTKQITVLDAPGHADFIPNMIAGAGQADVALLVVDATRGEFESGFDLGGQTREHALLVRSLGVSQLAVAINKLDTSDWSEERFIEICTKLKGFLKQAGFKESDVTFVPCSGLTGENLIKPPTESKLVKWYSGPNLIDVIDNFKTPERPITKPLRLSINDIFKGTGSGFCVSGRIETGSVNKSDRVLVCPTKEQAEVKGISINDVPHNIAFAGDQVSLTLSGIDINNISVGFIISDTFNVVPIATRFEARIVVFNLKIPITKGYPLVLHHQSLIESANIVKLTALLNKSTGEVVKNSPRCLGNNSVALVEIEVCRPICIEKYKDVKELGRVMLRVAGVTVAAGLVTSIIK